MEHEPLRSRLAVPVTSRDHMQGPLSAPLTLVEYGDYECYYCGNTYPVIKKLQEHFGDRLRFIFRNFPVATLHRHASAAAQAAEAAADQRKFWEMHDLLYEHQSELDKADLSHYALRLGLEIYKFESDLSGETHSRRIREDYHGGILSGVDSTPALFINDERYTGPLEYDSLHAALGRALENEKA